MKLAVGIRSIGFRKWYERQLLRSHAYLVLCFLCVIGVFASIGPALRFRGVGEQLADGAALLLCIGTGLWSLRRYLQLLAHAEATANQADCPGCQAYGRLELLQSDAQGENVQVKCRQCGHVWRIHA